VTRDSRLRTVAVRSLAILAGIGWGEDGSSMMVPLFSKGRLSVKKLLSLLICLGMIVSFGAVIGCGDKKETTKKEEKKEVKTETKTEK
jgi:hypothetical protein